MNNEDLITLTADIVSAHVANNNVAISDMAILVQRVHQALAGLGDEQPPAEAARTPAVSVRASIKPDHLVCLACGRRQRTLKRHLLTAHGLTPAQYRAEFGLADSYPMAAPEYAEMRREMAKKIGLGRKPGQRPKATAAAKPKAARKKLSVKG